MVSEKKNIMPLGARQRLAQDFGVSLPTVRAALNGITNSELADTIRAEAMRRGGELYLKIGTEYDSAEPTPGPEKDRQ